MVLDRLDSDLRSAGLSIVGVALLKEGEAGEGWTEFFAQGRRVAIQFAADTTSRDIAAAQAVLESWDMGSRKARSVRAVAVDYYQWLNEPSTAPGRMDRAMKLLAGVAAFIAVTNADALKQTDLPSIDPTEPETE